MLFVDGENLVFRTQTEARKLNQVLKGPRYQADVFLWLDPYEARRDTYDWMSAGGKRFNDVLIPPDVKLRELADRAFYYTSSFGDQDDANRVRESLHAAGFQARVFAKGKKVKPPRCPHCDHELEGPQRKSTKQVDIAMVTDILSNAALDNFDVALIVSSDSDFIPLIEEVKRLGKIVYLWGVGSAVKSSLRLACDYYYDCKDLMLRALDESRRT
jgi:uncharacterized LabA/DUF88 family protein